MHLPEYFCIIVEISPNLTSNCSPTFGIGEVQKAAELGQGDTQIACVGAKAFACLFLNLNLDYDFMFLH